MLHIKFYTFLYIILIYNLYNNLVEFEYPTIFNVLFLYKTIFHLLQDWIVEKLKSPVPALRLLLYSLPLVELQLFDWEPEKQIAWETDWSWNSSRESTNGFPWCFGARWFGFLGSPKMKGIGILRGIPPKPPGPKAPRKTIG